MKQSDPHPSDANGWMIALQEAPDDAFLADAFLNWLDQCEENQLAWSSLERSRAYAKERSSATILDTVSQVSTTKQRKDPIDTPAAASLIAFTRRSAYFAAAAAVTLIAIISIWPTVSLMLRADHSTRKAEIRQIQFSDGSVVMLGANSALAVNMTEKRRLVELLQGTAFFEVRRDTSRPFTVSYRGINTRVVGTAFEVRQTVSGASIAVNEGTVEVVRRTEVGDVEGSTKPVVQLQAGNRLDVGHTTSDGKLPRPIKTDKIATWRSGTLTFEDWPIADVVNAVRRHYRGTILVAPGLLRDGEISGIHDLNRPIEALRLVATARGLKVRQLTPWLATVTTF
ncbi:MAG: FecR domain-containing protein [Pseudomonadota bacterium]